MGRRVPVSAGGGTGGSGDPHNLGWYVTEVALNNAYPTANDGDWAIVGDTDSVWIWDSDTTTWVDSGEQALGDVVGPASATNNAIVRYDTETGKLVQDSLVTIDDFGSVNIPAGQSYNINGSALAASDIGAVPTTRTVNSKALSSDISLTASDVGAATTADITYENLNTNGDVGTTSGTVCAGDDSRLSDSRTPTSHGNEAHSSIYLTEIDIHGEDSTDEFSTGDEVLIYDSSLGENRKILRGNFFNGLEGDYISIHGTFEETTPATNMELLVYDPSVPANRRMTRANFLDGISAVGAFTDLTDTPASYEGYDETYYVRVNAASNALEFATVPSSYTLPTASADTLGGVKIGSGITITDGVISAASGGGLTWTEVTGTTQSASADNGYITNNESLVTVTLPSTCAVGKIIRITGKGAGGWKLAQNSGQQIIFGNKNSTSGTSGYIASLYQYDSVELLCITADTVFSVIGAVGDLDVV